MISSNFIQTLFSDFPDVLNPKTMQKLFSLLLKFNIISQHQIKEAFQSSRTFKILY